MTRTATNTVLVVDDESQFVQSASISLRVAGLKVVACTDGTAVLSTMKAHTIDVVLLDIMMPGTSGSAILPELVRLHPGVPVIMLTAVNDVDTAVECMRAGAFDYLVKPVEKSRLVSSVQRALELAALRSENRRLRAHLLREHLEHPEIFAAIVTRNRRMAAVFQYIEAIAATSMPVLITGETGVGKEMVATAVHAASGRTGEFVSVNIAGLNDALLSDTLFGHERGAFTGAEGRRGGLVAKAAGGTLFLDEIGDMPIESQAKLLRILEDGSYYPVGSDRPARSDARVVVATNRSPEQLRQSPSFRNDLYYRLQGHEVELPALRERPEDIPLLVDVFAEECAARLNKPAPTATPELVALLSTYSFPGNVRELRNLVFNATTTSKDGVLSVNTIREKLAPEGLSTGPAAAPSGDDGGTLWATAPRLPALKDAEAQLIAEALRRSNNNQTIAAHLLGMTRSALNKRLTRARE